MLGFGHILPKLRAKVPPVPSFFDRFGTPPAAYSIRDLNGSNPFVIEVRRGIDDSTRDFTAPEIINGTLAAWVNGAASDDTLPADFGSGAAAAYSLRYVSSGYSSDVVEVRRSSDDATNTFTPPQILDGSLVSWVGAGNDGFVRTLYDQKGSNDAQQTTSSAQPKIVDAGALVTENGLPAIQFDGVDDFFDLNSPISAFDPFYNSLLVTFDSLGYTLGTTLNTDTLRLRLDTQIRTKISNNDVDFTIPSTTGVQSLITWRKSASNNNSLAVNGISSPAVNQSGNLDVDYIGRSSSNYLNGTFQEWLIYDSDESSNRQAIEANTNNYYSIYTKTTQGFVRTCYNQGNLWPDAVQTTASNQPLIVDAGAVILDNGKPAIEGDGTQYLEFATQTLTSGFAIMAVHNGTGFLAGQASGGNDIIRLTGYQRLNIDGPAYTSNNNRDNLQTLSTFNRTDANELSIYYNETEGVNSPFSGASGDWGTNGILSYNQGSITFTGKLQEALFYDEDKSSLLADMQSEIVDFFFDIETWSDSEAWDDSGNWIE